MKNEILVCDNCGHSAAWKDHEQWNNDPPELNEPGQGYGLYKGRNATWSNCVKCDCNQLAVHTNWRCNIATRGEQGNPNRNLHLRPAKGQ